MQCRSLAVLTLTAALLACGGDSGTEPEPNVPELTIKDLRVVAVSGEQAAQVPGTEPQAVFRLTATVGADGYSDEPLVARIELTADAEAQGLTLNSIPTGTLVHWHLPDAGGTLYGGTTAIDDTAHVINRWAPGVVADTFLATSGRLEGDSIVTDATWELVVLPGPPSFIQVPDPIRMLVGQPWAGVSIRDAHDNAVPFVLEARGPVTAYSPSSLRGDAWGAGEVDVLVADTVVRTVDAFVYPNLASMGEWAAELECQTPDTTYTDVWRFEVEYVRLQDWPAGESSAWSPAEHAAAAGLDSTRATLAWTIDHSRTVLVNGDTLYDLATSDTTLTGSEITNRPYTIYRYGIGPMVVTADTTALVWPSQASWEPHPTGSWDPHPTEGHSDRPRRLPALDGREPAQATWPLTGLPALLPRVGTDPLTWSASATAACASDGWPNATAGTFTVRAGG